MGDYFLVGSELSECIAAFGAAVAFGVGAGFVFGMLGIGLYVLVDLFR